MDVRVPRPRFIVGSLPAPGGSVDLPDEEAAHARARRLSVGDAVVLIDGSGAEADGEIARLGRSGAQVAVSAVRAAGEAGPEIWLGVAAVRSERLSWIAEKSGELAVARFALIRSGRTQFDRAGAAAISRLERLVREAAKQSGGTRWPRCEGPLDLGRALHDAPGAARFFVDFSGESVPARLAARSAAILVGPEGGWTEPERDAARRADWSAVSLPAATLRTETAAIAAVILVRAAMVR
jgi:16S rRNA (uracil1498-N3)-methyltransferase